MRRGWLGNRASLEAERLTERIDPGGGFCTCRSRRRDVGAKREIDCCGFWDGGGGRREHVIEQPFAQVLRCSPGKNRERGKEQGKG